MQYIKNIEVNNMKIIDAHIHFRPDFDKFSLVAENSGHLNTEEHIKEVFERNNVVHAIVMSNGDLSMEKHQYPSFMSYCVGLDSNCFFVENPIEYYIEMTEKHLQQKNCVGIKLYPGYCPQYIYDKIYDPFYDLAVKYNKPVAVHTGATSRAEAYLKYSHPFTLDEASVKHPDVNFIMCHFGNPFLSEAAAVVEKNKNVAVDISGILEGNFDMNLLFQENSFYIETLKSWLSYTGAWDQIMYGTDFPIVNVDKYIEFIKKIVPEKHHEKVFYENAKRIYSLDI